MKPKRLITNLATIALILALDDGIQHFFKARTAKALLSIMTPKDQGYRSMQDAIQEHFHSSGQAAVIVFLLAILILTVWKQWPPPIANEPPK